jgi:16S rRNA (cytidine1402-2'-O)-methyltransferase
LKEADLILAEDTRQTKKLLDHFQIQKQLTLPTINSMSIKRLSRCRSAYRPVLLLHWLAMAAHPVYRTPAIYLLLPALEHNIGVECLPGPTAFVPALVNSGFATDEFVFIGFLPHKKGRMTKLKEVASISKTILLYESPFRILKLLEELKLHIGLERRISCSREISKMFEETVRGTADELIAHFTKKEPRGEFVVADRQQYQRPVSKGQRVITCAGPIPRASFFESALYSTLRITRAPKPVPRHGVQQFVQPKIFDGQ